MRILHLILAVLFVATALAGCGIRYDDTFAVPEISDEVSCNDEDPTHAATLSGRLKVESTQPDRRHRMDNLAGDPRAVPTPRDLRESRSFVHSQVELFAEAGPHAYRSDGSSSDPAKVQFVPAKRALTIGYAATDRLNWFDGQPHALQLYVYHLKKRNRLDKTVQSVAGERVLLSGDLFNDDVVTVERIVIQPGEKGELVIDRPEDGRYVAVAAGYADGRVFIGEYGTGEYSVNGSTVLSRRKKMFRPLPMRLHIEFNETAMAVYSDDMIWDSLRGVARLQAAQLRDIRCNELFRTGTSSISAGRE